MTQHNKLLRSRMASTRNFEETMVAWMQSDPAFARAMFGELIMLFVDGDHNAAKLVLRDLVTATIGFEQLAQEIGKPVKRLRRMLSSSGNPSLACISTIVAALKKCLQLDLSVLGTLRERPERIVSMTIGPDMQTGRIDPDWVDATTEEDIARQKAYDELADQRYFLVTPEQYDAFLKLLDRPAQPNLGLERLFSRKGLWESDVDDRPPARGSDG
ncbi:MAG: DUF1778 domain-containing protein [Rhodocyclaceae bacterium]|nr:DUF1778 domain-containing protein [Rhodocyclaceae bacterium]MDZ4216314.1 DUF1778 domain-containing protein [Rhodocyclaceae bacterium]